jgi:hypothetical protein
VLKPHSLLFSLVVVQFEVRGLILAGQALTTRAMSPALLVFFISFCPGLSSDHNPAISQEAGKSLLLSELLDTRVYYEMTLKYFLCK